LLRSGLAFVGPVPGLTGPFPRSFFAGIVSPASTPRIWSSLLRIPTPGCDQLVMFFRAGSVYPAAQNQNSRSPPKRPSAGVRSVAALLLPELVL